MIEDYLAECRALVLEEIRACIPRDSRYTGGLYGMMLDYPLRGAKALRPSLCIATSRMLGGALDATLPTAAALELYHNAFLVHDDVEDGSDLRRGAPTLHAAHGVPTAVNVGDGMLAIAMRPLLQNTRTVGVRRALRVLEELTGMALRSAEGQALELSWVHRRDWTVTERDYLHMVYLKTACYSFVTPIRCGSIVADASGLDRPLVRMGALLGIAFQIQDDILNLRSTPRYGKEADGDLWEGKHTLLLVRAIRLASPDEQAEARRILTNKRADKTHPEVAWLRELIERNDGIGHAQASAERHALRARRLFDHVAGRVPRTVHRDFLEHLIDYVIRRTW